MFLFQTKVYCSIEQKGVVPHVMGESECVESGEVLRRFRRDVEEFRFRYLFEDFKFQEMMDTVKTFTLERYYIY